MNIVNTFKKAFETKNAKNWDVIYIALDIHDTVFKGCYDKKEQYEWLGEAKECLQLLSQRKDIVLIGFSSSHEEALRAYDYVFAENDIVIKYYNANPEVRTNYLSNFDEKFYFNILLDDKAGFEPETDWKLIKEYLCE